MLFLALRSNSMHSDQRQLPRIRMVRRPLRPCLRRTTSILVTKLRSMHHDYLSRLL